LIDYFLKQFAAKHDKRIKGMSAAARHRLFLCDWRQGNVRELRNVIESMVVVDYDGLLDMDDLPEDLAGPPEPSAEPAEQSLAGLVGRSLEEVEKLFIAETLRLSGGNRELAASKLGMGERTLYRKIKEFGL
jgi:two-component system response regulator HydG